MIDNPKGNPGRLAGGITKRAGQILFVLVFQGAMLFISAGTLTWIWAWVFLGIYFLSVFVNAIFMIRTNLETIAERGTARGWKNWDKVVSGGWGLMQYLFIPLVAGLDHRFGWTPAPGIAWNFVGAGIFAAGLGLFSWAMITNAFFSTAVRIQNERGQTVCRSGPYRIVRHPGYTGAIFQSLGISILLSSCWALVPGAIAAGFLLMRTYLEDRTLKTELKGYQEYARHVRFRIIPGLW
jgi:protein-S-isoprenylcysteine O-methyltransferase Ste14